jgi:hypothetical protein
MVHPEDRIVLGHLAESPVVAIHEAHRDWPDLELERYLVDAARVRENERRAERRMAGEGQFLRDGEDAHGNAAFAFDRLLARNDERGLGQTHFAGERLHLGVGEAARVGEYG